MKRFCMVLTIAFFTVSLVSLILVSQTSYSQETEKAKAPSPATVSKSGSVAVKEYPLYITFVFHIETGRDLDEQRFRDAATDLRAMAEVFKKHGGTLAAESDEPFALACAQYGDNVLLEIEKKYGFTVGSYPHGNPSAATKAAVEALGVKDLHVFGNWGKRRNRDWVADAIANGFKYTCAAQAMVYPNVEAEDPWDHETVPWSRADRLHPWRIKSSEEWDFHDPNSPLVYIPGESEGIQGAYESDLTGNLVRPRPRPGSIGAKSKTAGGQARPGGLGGFDSRDVTAAIEMMQKALVFAEKDKVNTWYIASNITGRDHWDQKADLFAEWIDRINKEFVAPGLVQWKTLDEMYDAYVDWEKRTAR